MYIHTCGISITWILLHACAAGAVHIMYIHTCGISITWILLHACAAGAVHKLCMPYLKL